MQVALSAIAPFVVGGCATQVTMASGERYGRDTLPFVLVGMVRGAVRFRFLAQSGRIPWHKNASSFPGCHRSHSLNLVVAEAGFHNARSTFGSHVRIFPDAGWGEG